MSLLNMILLIMIRKHVSWIIEEAHIYIQSYSSKSSNSSTCSINFQQ